MMMLKRRSLLTTTTLLVLTVTFCPAAFSATPPADKVLDAQMHQLGKRTNQTKTDQPRLDVRLDSEANTTEFTVQITHQGIVQPWFLEVNGRRIAQLPMSYRAADQTYFTLPTGTLTNGANTLSVVADDFGREISVGKILLFRQPLRDLLKLRKVSVSVIDEQTGKPVPARISIVSDKNEPAEIFYSSSTNTAIRGGLIYTSGERTAFEIPEGRYEFYATRGMEWSLAHESASLSAGPTTAIELHLRREVDTTGFIAADTHIHTLTFSGHGDASIYERMLTLAGEGVEFAVATDHNHVTDYVPYQSQMKLNRYFTPVRGDEITTRNGHFNAFPLSTNGPVPNYHESDWVKLVNDARMKGAKVVIWNHPNYPDPENSPLTRFQFNHASGDRLNGPAFKFDAMELVNSCSPTTVHRPAVDEDPQTILTDWFAILNRGEKIIGVGASDSHTVYDPVGQGRTYIRSSTDVASKIKVEEMVRNFRAGDTTVSYGIFADAVVNGHQHMGETLRPADGKVSVNLRIASADFVQPRRAVVYLNGVAVAEQKLKPQPGKPFNQHVTFAVNVPKHDAYLVCAVFGDGVAQPFWPTLGKFTAAVTNPLYLDDDGDGEFEFPRTTAQKMLAATDGTLKSVWPLLENSDDALAGQMLGLLYLNRDPDFVRQLDARVKSASGNRKLYQTFLQNSPLIVLKQFPASKKERAGKRSATKI